MSEAILERAQAQALLNDAGLTAWKVLDDALERTFATEGWPTSLLLTNAIGYVCEAAWHHADIHVSYNRVVVRLSTHSAGGITMKDIELAQKIEEVIMWRPAEEAALSGVPRPFVS
nr:4a-hydroxytetrahydrobiopterin dehydratase [Ardenticatena sp.]